MSMEGQAQGAGRNLTRIAHRVGRLLAGVSKVVIQAAGSGRNLGSKRATVFARDPSQIAPSVGRPPARHVRFYIVAPAPLPKM
jgi:hypothetical protein